MGEVNIFGFFFAHPLAGGGIFLFLHSESLFCDSENATMSCGGHDAVKWRTSQCEVEDITV